MEAFGGLLSGALGLVFLAGMVHYLKIATANDDLPRNGAFGIRTKATRASDLAWRVGHQAAGPWLHRAARIGYLATGLVAISAVLIASTGISELIGVGVMFAGYAAMITVLLLGGRAANNAAKSVHADA